MGHQCMRAAVMKYCRLGGLNNRYLLSHGSGGWKAKTKMSAGWLSSDMALLGL